MNVIAMLWMATGLLTGFGLGALTIWLINRGTPIWMILTVLGVLLVLIAGMLP